MKRKKKERKEGRKKERKKERKERRKKEKREGEKEKRKSQQFQEENKLPFPFHVKMSSETVYKNMRDVKQFS